MASVLVVAVGVLGAQEAELALVRVRVRGFMEELLPLDLVVAVEVVVLVVQIRPDEPSNIPSLSAVEVCHAPQSVWANDDAPVNIHLMRVTLDTSHFERSPLNDDAEWNMLSMLVTLDTSHLDRSPLNDDAL